MRPINYKKCLFLVLLLIAVCRLPAAGVSASKIDDLKRQIKETNSQKAEIEKEIAQYRRQIDSTIGKKNTLKNELYRLELNAKQLNASIHLTKKKIEESALNIEKLTMEIAGKTDDISRRKKIMGEIIRQMNESESRSLVEITLMNDRFSDFFGDLERMKSVQTKIKENLNELREARTVLSGKKEREQKEKRRQERLRADLLDQKYLVNRNKANTRELLAETKNKEANYRKLLKEKLAKKEAFERELAEMESQLRIEIDPNSIPPAGSGVLRWPFSGDYMAKCGSYKGYLGNIYCVTQYFGKTKFATKNPQIYNGAGHTGLDFRAPYGTRVRAALSGVVRGVGNTDDVRGCYSYGKWVLIRHNNGLSTLYAHLSKIKVNSGQSVAAGDTIGYSGKTGYATGPHLHFTVYATQGVKITKFDRSINCKNAYIPIADKKAYLNPLSYL